MAPWELIDRLLDRITMYRLLIYYLTALIIVGVVESLLGILHFNPIAMALTAVYIFVVCILSNALFAWAWGIPINHESSHITALILALIISPVTDFSGILFVTAAGGLAIASKYLLAVNRQHLFNPAAIAVVLTSFAGNQSASWWVGSTSMWLFVLFGGLLMARKIRRMQMVLTFIIVALVSGALFSVLGHQSVTNTLHQMVFSSALLFLAFVMLTEPLTSPHRLKEQRWYAALTGLLFPPQVHVLSLYSTPELALCIGNLFAAFISKRVRVLTKLIEKVPLSDDTTDFLFKPDRPFTYLPGQYMEWTLPHPNMDARGERRYLTLASSPTEDTLHLGVKFYPNGSTFKRAMLGMNADTQIAAGQLSGDFVLPDDAVQKLAFIAGGIGITPFRSMAKYLIDTGQRRDVVLLYGAKSVSDVVYQDVFEQARQRLGMPSYYFVGSSQVALPNKYYSVGRIDGSAIKAAMPDYMERLFYVSGPHAMVESVRNMLRQLGVPARHIKIDFFPGYA